MKGMKKPLALLLALVMAFSLLSVGAWADEEEVPAEEPAQIEEALPETPAEEPAEAPEEEAAPAEEVAETPAEEPAEEAAPAEEPAEAPDEEAVLLDGENVAKIGEAEYATLAAAVEAAQSKDTITLTADISDMETVTIPAGKELTLDLAGYTITAAVNATDSSRHYYAIDNSGTLTLKDTDGNGKIEARGILNKSSGTMTIESGHFVAIDSNGGAAIWNEGNLTMNGGTLEVTYVGTSSDQYGVAGLNNSGTAVINGGTFTSVNKRAYAIISTGNITVNTATVSGAHGGLAVDAGTAVVKGGTFTSTEFYGLYVSNDGKGTDPEKAAVTVNGGEFTGKTYSVWIGSDVNNPVNSTIEIFGGTFNNKLSIQKNVEEAAGIVIKGGTFKEGIGNAKLADGYAINETTGVVFSAVAKVGETLYATLPEAVAAAGTTEGGGTVTLLRDASGDGVKTQSGYNVTIDFDGHTYTVTKLVGSTGTVSQCFQLLKGSTVELKNGTIVSDTALLMIQNYSNLTLEDMTLDATKCAKKPEVIGGNNGSVTVKGNTVLKGVNGNDVFDLYYWPAGGYNGVVFTFDESFNGSVSGQIEYGRDSGTDSGWEEKTVLNINSPEGTFDVTYLINKTSTPNINITGGKFTADVPAAYIPDGYKQNDEKAVVPVATIETTTPTAEGAVAAVSGTTENNETFTVDMSTTSAATTEADEETGALKSATNPIAASSVDLTRLVLAELDTEEGETSEVKTAAGENTNAVEVAMSVSVSETTGSEDATQTTKLEIHPTYKFNSGAAKELGNEFIKGMMEVRIPGIVKAGRKLSALWHYVNGAKQKMDLSKVQVLTDGTLVFENDNFCVYDVDTDPDKDSGGNAYHQFEVKLAKNTGVDGHGDLNGNDMDEYESKYKTETIAPDTVIYDIIMKANATVKINALDFTLNKPTGLTVSSVTVLADPASEGGTVNAMVQKSGETNGKYGFYGKETTVGGVTTQDTIELTTAEKKIGTVTFTVDGGLTQSTQLTFSLSNVKAKEVAVNETRDVTATEATATIEIDPEYTITIQNGAYVSNAGADVAVGANTLTYTYSILRGVIKKGTEAASSIADAVIPDGYELKQYTVTHDADDNWATASYKTDTELNAAISNSANFKTLYGDVTLTVEYTAKKYDVKLYNPTVSGLVKQATYETAPDATTYKYDITGAIYKSDETAVGDDGIVALSLTAYDFVNFKSVASESASAGNWTVLDITAGKDVKFKGKWGDVALQAQYTPTEYTITLKNPGTTNGVIVDADAALVDATDTASYTYTVEGKVSKATNAADVVIADSSLWYDATSTPKKTHYTFAGYKVQTAPTETGNATWGAANAAVTLGEGKKLGTGKYGNVTLLATYTANNYTATINLGANVTYDGPTGKYTANALAEGDTKPTGGTVTYTAEDGAKADFFTTPTRPGYEFKGWKVSYAEDTDVPTVWSGATTTPTTTTTGAYGNVTLTAVWKILGEFVEVNYRYAYSSDSLKLLAVENKYVPTSAGGYTYKNNAMFKVADATKAAIYAKAFGKVDGGDTDKVNATGWTIYAYIATTVGTTETKEVADGNVEFVASATNKVVVYSGDMTGNGSIDSGDYGNVSAMIANSSQYSNAAIDVESRLRADVANEAADENGAFTQEVSALYGTIKDVDAILSAAVNS